MWTYQAELQHGKFGSPELACVRFLQLTFHYSKPRTQVPGIFLAFQILSYAERFLELDLASIYAGPGRWFCQLSKMKKTLSKKKKNLWPTFLSLSLSLLEIATWVSDPHDILVVHMYILLTSRLFAGAMPLRTITSHLESRIAPQILLLNRHVVSTGGNGRVFFFFLFFFDAYRKWRLQILLIGFINYKAY